MLDALFSHSFWPSISFSDEKQSVAFDQIDTLEELASKLTSGEMHLDDWMASKLEIRAFIQKHAEDYEGLDAFLTTTTRWGLENHPQKFISAIAGVMDLNILTEVVRFKQDDPETCFDNVFDWAAEHAPLYPDPSEPSWRHHFFKEWKRNRPIILYAIPNLLNILVGAFNFLDTHKRYTTIWEKHLILEIMYKFILIPYVIFTMLQPYVGDKAKLSTYKIYYVAALLFITIGIACYQRWFRPIPDEIVHSENLDKKMVKGLIDPKVGQIKEMERLINALEADSNVLLIALSGEGKTSLFHHLLALKHQGKLSEKLQKLFFYEVDCGVLISHYSFGHAELITQMKEQIEGYEDNTLLFFDGFNEIVTNRAAFLAFTKRFANDKPRARFIAAITEKEYQELEKLDKDGSFRARMTIIRVQSSSDEQNDLIIRDWLNRNASDIPVTEDAIEAILELSNSDRFLPGIGRPAKVIKILEDSIGKCRATYNPNFVTGKLNEARQKYQALKLQAEHDIKLSPPLLKDLREVRREIATLEADLKEKKGEVKNIKKCLESQQELNAIFFRATHLIAQASDSYQEDILDEKSVKLSGEHRLPLSKESIGEDVQITFLWYYFYGLHAMKSITQAKLDDVRPMIPVQVDGELVRQVFRENQGLEEEEESDVEEEVPLTDTILEDGKEDE